MHHARPHTPTTTTTPVIPWALTVYPGRTSFFDLLLSFIQHPRESVFSPGGVAWNGARTKERHHPRCVFGPRRESASMKRHHSVVALGMSLKDADVVLGDADGWNM